MQRVHRVVLLLVTLVAIFGIYLFAVRPWFLQWGATAEEQRAALPGDDIIPAAAREGTRAITINARAEQVFPWLAQLGQDRAGFYSYDLLENLVGCEMPSIDRLDPDKQAWKPGDKLWMYPPAKAGGIGFGTLRTHIPGRALGFATRATGTPLSAPEDGSWTFVLQPVDESTTRLLIRGRGAAGRGLKGAAFDQLIFEPAHFVMERRMMTGIKQLAEGHGRERIRNHVQVVLWTIVFVWFAGSAIMLVVSRRWQRALLTLLASAFVFQILTFLQPPVLVGVLLTVLVVVLPYTHRNQRNASTNVTTPHSARMSA